MEEFPLHLRDGNGSHAMLVVCLWNLCWFLKLKTILFNCGHFIHTLKQRRQHNEPSPHSHDLLYPLPSFNHCYMLMFDFQKFQICTYDLDLSHCDSSQCLCVFREKPDKYSATSSPSSRPHPLTLDIMLWGEILTGFFPPKVSNFPSSVYRIIHPILTGL